MKAQIQQVFIYVMAIIVIGFLVVVGGRMIFDVLDDRCSVEEGSFISSLQREISGAEQYGTKHTVKIGAPCEHTMLCFIRADAVNQGDNSLVTEYPDGSNANSDIEEKHWANVQIMETNVEDSIPYNIYLMEAGPLGKLLPITFDSRITTSLNSQPTRDAVCFTRTNGVFTFRLEGQGRNGILVNPIAS